VRGTPRTEPAEHGTRNCYNHGPSGRGPGCHCDDCRQASRDYKNARIRAIAYGRWQPFVDAEPVREHLLTLSKAKIGRRRVAELSGIHPSRLLKILYGAPDQPPPRQIRQETAEAILAVSTHAGPSPKVPVDGTGARRRLQALAACHWTPRVLAAEAQSAGVRISPTTLRAIMRGEQITGKTDEAVRAMYQRLWDRPPPETTPKDRAAADQAAQRARDEGWAPPAAWEDSQLDASDGKPVPGWQPGTRTTRRAVDVAEDGAWVMETEGCDIRQAAVRLRIPRDTLWRSMQRAALYEERQAAAPSPDREMAEVTALPLPPGGERDEPASMTQELEAG
jgi:hypothetical protein